jgi:hypothetical protein
MFTGIEPSGDPISQSGHQTASESTNAFAPSMRLFSGSFFDAPAQPVASLHMLAELSMTRMMRARNR